MIHAYTKFQHIGIAGGGAWGTALAVAAVRAGREVSLWVREEEVVASIAASHENTRFLPGVLLDPAITASTNKASLGDCDLVLLAAPAQYLRDVAREFSDCLAPAVPLVICAKGIELDSGALMSEVARDVLGATRPLAILTGPNFASEVARGLPSALTLASEDARLCETTAAALASTSLRPYITDDVVGAQIGGAAKNVMAIAAGIAIGRGLGENARAAIMTRGFAEMTRYGTTRGANFDTMAGLCGLGDLVLTCSSTSSRNFSLGKAIGEGQSAADLMANRQTVAEGAHTAPVLQRLARAEGIDMPIVDAVVALLDGARAADVADGLLSRPLTTERRDA